MAELKTKETGESVDTFLDAIADDQKRADCRRICEMMAEISGEGARMWGPAMVGFGRYDYKYASGREGSWFRVGFSPRARNITLYLMTGFSSHDELMEKLGKYKTGKSCLYIKSLSDVDEAVLRELIHDSLVHLASLYD